jgi:hypothetical protein
MVSLPLQQVIATQIYLPEAVNLNAMIVQQASFAMGMLCVIPN